MKQRWVHFLCLCLSASLLALAFHFPACAALAFFAFVPYFFSARTQSPGEALRSGLLFGFLFNLGTGYWLAYVNVPGCVLLALYLALYFAAFAALANPLLGPQSETTATLWSKNLKAALGIASLWTLLEALRGWLFGGIPWALLAYTQWRNLWFIQIADIVGAAGVSFLVMLANALIFKLLQAVALAWKHRAGLSPEDRRHRLLHLAVMSGALTLVLGLPYAVGARALSVREAFYSADGPKAVIRVATTQGNIPQDQKWDRKIKNIIFEKYRRLTLMGALDKADLVVWPETSFPGYLEDELMMAAQLRSLARQSRTDVLVGAPTLGELEKGLRFYNSAVLYGPNGEERQRYSKLHLVPFGEYVPFEPVLGVVRHFVEIGHFSPGVSRTLFEYRARRATPSFKARYAVLICFEDIFPGLVRSFCADGADFLVNITNDAWFGNSTAPYQHAQASVFRAVENRVPVIRSANTGYSCFITAEGRIVGGVNDNGQELNVTGHATADLVLKKGRSFYTRFGDVFLLVPLALVFLAAFERSRQQKYSRI